MPDADYAPQLGDIVLYNQPDGTQIPAIITRVLGPASVNLVGFGVGGAWGSSNPIERGTQAGQWQPRPR